MTKHIDIFFDPELWKEYKSLRKELKKPLTPTNERWSLKHLHTLSGGNRNMAEAILRQTLAGGWRGLFALGGQNLEAFRKSEHENVVNKRKPCEYCGKPITESNRFTHEDEECPNYRPAPQGEVLKLVNNFRLRRVQ